MIITSGYDEKIFGKVFLQGILEWVADQFDPGEMYSDDILKEYIRENFSPEEVYPMDYLRDAVEET